MATLRDAALGYAGIGLAVFPCQPRGKAPLLPGDGGYKLATREVDQLHAWWDEHPDANIGLPAALNRLLILDVDPRNGGLPTLAALLGQSAEATLADLLPLLPETWTSRTGGGGLHVWFSLPDWPHRGSAGEGLDVKANGYVIVPPCPHPDGGQYRWIKGRRPSNCHLAEVPAWLEAVIRRHERPPETAPEPAPAPQPGARLTEEEAAREALRLLNPSRADEYASWIEVGQALHATSEALLPDWIAWSRQSPKFDSPDDCERHWRSFHAGRGITAGTLTALARTDGDPDFLKPGWRARQTAPSGPAAGPASVNGHAKAPTPQIDDRDAPAPAEAHERATVREGHLALAVAFAGQYRAEWMPTSGRQWYRYHHGVWRARDNDEIRGLLWEWLNSVSDPRKVTSTVVNSVLDACATMPGWRVPVEDLNRHPYLINCTNGVYDLQSGELKPHDPALLQTVQRPFAFDREAGCERWLRFLGEVCHTAEGAYDPQLAGLVQEFFGYCLIPTAKAQKAMVWSGGGQNGKGVATDVLIHLVGRENVASTDITALDNEYVRAALRDKLLAVASEVPTKKLVDDAYFKAIVAGDQIDARLPYGHPFSFRPHCRLLITCNELPTSRDQTFAFYRRLILVPWLAQISDDQRDNDLGEILAEHELPGIFRWAVGGLQRLAPANFRFSPADAAARALEEYRTEGNTVLLWAQEELELAPGAWVANADLYRSYSDYCKRFGYTPKAREGMTRRLKAEFPQIDIGVRRADGLARGVRGIGLKGYFYDEV